MEMESEKFCLRWNDFEPNISNALRELREEKDFFDITLACDDSQIQAHKVILSACSSFFKSVLRRNPHQHPLLYLRGVKYNELMSILNFMYRGEVNIAQEELNSFLSVAEDLKVKGLTQGNQDESKAKVNSIQAKPQGKEISTRENDSNRVPKPPRAPTALQQHQVFSRQSNTEEVIPVKSEPHDPGTQTQPLYHHDVHVEDHQQTSTGQNTNMQYSEDLRTVALDDSYVVEEDYNDYQYEEAYGGVGMEAAATGREDVDSVIHSKMSKNDAGEWQCNDCFKTSRVKTNILEHIEATHVDSPGYNCNICMKFYKNRHSLRNHKNSKHKDVSRHGILFKPSANMDMDYKP